MVDSSQDTPVAVDELDDIYIPVRAEKTTTGKKTIVHRVFYLDVNQMHPNDIPRYLEDVREMLGDDMESVKEAKDAGLWEDFYIPIRPTQRQLGLWARFKQFLFGDSLEDAVKLGTRIELHKVEL